ncbi:predicted protein [Naegleria gruberi]|uniref:Predicted protein n=1 Tax=Naegleria gruberi TaxID=5762 RepID=D2VHP4_NAEGR|nr:uncharacterized protein NAEGRDRAFT_68398 [Naegleria gruberi]EFC43712.1 predicted protein [Naegleria gruberi]|eukprot:XP_002676456.1 predicted protein [Naegleria gruberi strain NEG-M]
MTKVKLTNVEVKNNPTKFTDNIELDVTLECMEEISSDLDLELVYVGSSASADEDQVLESVSVGPVKVGTNKFVVTAPAPNVEKISASDLLDCTVLLLKVSYNNQLFSQVGYFVSNQYTDKELQEAPPSKPIVEKLVRTLNDKPRVTTFQIEW